MTVNAITFLKLFFSNANPTHTYHFALGEIDITQLQSGLAHDTMFSTHVNVVHQNT